MEWNDPICSDDEGSSRMIYEGCANQEPSVDEAAGKLRSV
jgi:hypothetical protein